MTKRRLLDRFVRRPDCTYELLPGKIETKLQAPERHVIVSHRSFLEREVAETVRLDTVLKEIGRDPYLVMLDVQGMELQLHLGRATNR